MSNSNYLLRGQVLFYGYINSASFIFFEKASGLKAGSSTAGKETAGTVTSKQVREIAESKMKDLNANDIDGAMQIY